MDIRRNVLIVICILSASMILSSCDKGGNHTESELGGSNMSDVNDVVMNEEDKPVEPRVKTLLTTEIKNTDGTSSEFTAKIADGEYIRIAIRSYNSASMNIIVYVNGSRYMSYKVDKDNQGLTIPYKITSTSNFEIVYEVTNGMDMAISVRVKQYVEKP